MKIVILVGHSHTYALKAGLEELGVGNDRCIYSFLPKIEAAVLSENSNKDLVVEIREQVRAQCLAVLGLGKDDDLAGRVAADDISVLLSVGGNEHNIIGLIRTEDQFDFILPDMPDLNIDGAKIMPLDAAYQQVMRSLAYTKSVAAALSEVFGGNVTIQAPPPPIGDNQYIIDKLDSYFKETYGDNISINDPIFRYKIFHLREMIMRAFCGSLEIRYVDSPPEFVSGLYLDPQAYGQDATHANHKYGVAAMRRLYPAQFGSSIDAI